MQKRTANHYCPETSKAALPSHSCSFTFLHGGVTRPLRVKNFGFQTLFQVLCARGAQILQSKSINVEDAANELISMLCDTHQDADTEQAERPAEETPEQGVDEGKREGWRKREREKKKGNNMLGIMVFQKQGTRGQTFIKTKALLPKSCRSAHVRTLREA